MSKLVNFRCTDEEKKMIEQKATELSMGLSDYIRFVALKSIIIVEIKRE